MFQEALATVLNMVEEARRQKMKIRLTVLHTNRQTFPFYTWHRIISHKGKLLSEKQE